MFVANAAQEDMDLDDVGDVCDNCPDLFNTGQTDIDSDGLGNPCDPDMDGDGLPNEWEILFALDPGSTNSVHGATGDPDFDMYSNWEEFVADTQPNNYTSLLLITSFELGDTNRIGAPTVTGRVYSLEYLLESDWFESPGQTNRPGTGSELIFEDVPALNTRSYRLRVGKQE